LRGNRNRETDYAREIHVVDKHPGGFARRAGGVRGGKKRKKSPVVHLMPAHGNFLLPTKSAIGI